MKKKFIFVSLLTIGVALLCISIVFTIISTGSRNIIGGADLHTFLFVFFHEKSGLYSTLAFLGIGAIIASVIVGVVRKKK